MDKYIFTMMLEITYGIGHFTMNHSRVLAKGLAGVIADAKAAMARLPKAERESEKGLFVRRDDPLLRGGRFLRQALRETGRGDGEEGARSGARRGAREIARVCERVPEHPAGSFHEAVQSVYFIHLISQIESGGNSISLGRIDQVLYPYYRADVEAGRITPERARELLSLLFIKTNEIWNVLEEAFIPGGEGTEGKTTQNVTVGGMGPDGSDATNELSYIGLDAYADVRTVQPNFGVRLSKNPPADFFNRASNTRATGCSCTSSTTRRSCVRSSTRGIL
jgi:formate C-acetyltransferase